MMGASTAYNPQASLPTALPPGVLPTAAPVNFSPYNPVTAEDFVPYRPEPPQPPQYLPFGSATTMGPTPQHPSMQNFNFMAPGGGQQQQQQQAPAPQAPQQTALSRVLDQFLGNTPSGKPQVRMFGGMGVPGLGAGSLGMIDRAIQDERLPRDYRVPFSNQVGVGFRAPTFNQ